MDAISVENCTAFAGDVRLASGSAAEVAVAMREALDRDKAADVRAFEDVTAKPLEFDLRGAAADVRGRYAAEAPSRGPGRPKLGVVAREVTLLPRHWDWLAAQPGGASVALRKLVEQARAEGSAAETARSAQEAAFRFMGATLGDRPGFEEACRALFACDGERFDELAAPWPEDLRRYARTLAAPAFEPGAAALLKRG